MKRCPQCEFIYEDEQSLCDMDGVLLVFDSRTLPNLHALATVPATPKAAHRRNRAVPAFATLVLTLVLALVYYVSTRQPNYPPPPIPASTMSVAPVTIPTPEPTPVKEEVRQEVKEPLTEPVKKPATKTAAVSQTKRTTTSQPKKDDSKVNSILKKTGRILKKPFKKF